MRGEALEQSASASSTPCPWGKTANSRVRNYYVSRDFNNRLPFTGGGAVDLQRFFAGGGVSYTRGGSLAGRPNRLVVGLDYDDQDDHRRRFDNRLGALGALTLDQDERVVSTGLFVQDELSLTENLQVSLRRPLR